MFVIKILVLKFCIINYLHNINAAPFDTDSHLNKKVVDVIKGKSVELKCTVDTFDGQVIWVFNETQYLFVANHKRIDSDKYQLNGNNLIIKDVGLQDEGEYQCKIFTYPSDEVTFQLNVLYEPVCKPNQRTTIGKTRNEFTQIICNVDAKPSNDLKFYWDPSSSIESVSINGTKSIATFAPNIDYGKIICWAENKIGRQQVPCVYTLVPARPPESVRNCLLTDQKLSSFKIKCEAGFDGGFNQTFTMELFNQDFKIMYANLSSSVPEFSIEKVPPGKQLICVIYSSNTKGRSAFSFTANTLPLPQTVESHEFENDEWTLSGLPTKARFTSSRFGLSEFSYKLEWEIKSRTDITEYILRIQKVNDKSEEWKIIFIEPLNYYIEDFHIKQSFIIEELEENAEYHLELIATNKVGSSRSDLFTFTTSPGSIVERMARIEEKLDFIIANIVKK